MRTTISMMTRVHPFVQVNSRVFFNVSLGRFLPVRASTTLVPMTPVSSS
jgi:hypothetical protein